jgi:hypothetical protein
MRIPAIRGLIERRILVNYRVAPDVLQAVLPPPFRPKLYRGMGMAGICLIRLGQVRPAVLPAWMGIGSENAAHRVAVEWTDSGRVREGVFVRRRDTSSWLNVLTGGRIFAGYHHHARFEVRESPQHLEVALRSDDGRTDVSVVGDVAASLPSASIFGALEEASAFFQTGSIGYSATPDPHRLQGLELRCHRWQVEPMDMTAVRSSFFDDRSLFPESSIAFDCALLMRGIEHEWHGQADMCCSNLVAAGACATRIP